MDDYSCELCRDFLAEYVCASCGREVCEYCVEEYDTGWFCDLCDPDELDINIQRV